MKLFKYIGCLLFVLLAVYACKEDDQFTAYRELPDFYIDTVGAQVVFEIQQSIEEVVIDPIVVYEGNAELEYLWLTYGANSDTVGHEKQLTTTIPYDPGSYTAELQVTEKSTGLKALMRYTITVLSPRPYGWLVAYETTSGGSTDVSLIRSSEIIKDLSEDVVMRDIYSEVAGSPLAGTPIAVISNERSPNADLLFTTETGVRLNRPDYSVTQNFFQMFIGEVTPSPSPEAVMEVPFFGNHLINNKKVYWQYSGSYVGAITVDEQGYEAAPFGYPIYAKNGGFYDMLNGRFIYMEQQSSDGRVYQSPDVVSDARFDLSDIGKKLLYIGLGFGQTTAPSNFDVLKYAFFEDMDGSARWFYGMDFPNAPNNHDVCIIDISTMPDIFDAKLFALGEVGPVAYYATDDKLYSFAYDVSSNVASVPDNGFTAPAGETITCVELFKSSGSGYSGAETKSNRILFVATYNEGTQNGKVYLLEANPTSGAISPTPLNEFEDFGRIKDMCLKPS